MLTRFRIEVEGADSAAACEDELAKYEHALQLTEVGRFNIDHVAHDQSWSRPAVERDFFTEELGREVTDEVIEYDAGLPGYRGRRVVQFKRLDTRWAAVPQDGIGTENPARSSFRITSPIPPRVSEDSGRVAQ